MVTFSCPFGRLLPPLSGHSASWSISTGGQLAIGCSGIKGQGRFHPTPALCLRQRLHCHLVVINRSTPCHPARLVSVLTMEIVSVDRSVPSPVTVRGEDTMDQITRLDLLVSRLCLSHGYNQLQARISRLVSRTGNGPTIWPGPCCWPGSMVSGARTFCSRGWGCLRWSCRFICC